MKWRIEVKPTSYALIAYTWTAQREDYNIFLSSEGQTFPTAEAAMQNAKGEVTIWTERAELVEENTLLEPEFDPFPEPEPEVP